MTWSKYQSHNTVLARVTDPGDLFALLVDSLATLDSLVDLWPNGSRTLHCERAWLQGIRARSLDLDAENDMQIR